MWGLAMLGIAGVGALGAAYIVGGVHGYAPGWENATTWALGAVSVIAAIVAPWWLAFLAVGAFAGQVVPQLYISGMKYLADKAPDNAKPQPRAANQ